MGLMGFAVKLAAIFTYDGYLAREFPALIHKGNYFGFFTYTTNILVDFWLVLIALAIFLGRDKNPVTLFLAKASVQGFLTAMIFVVGVLYCSTMFWFDTPYSWSLWWGNFVTLWHHVVAPGFMIFLFFHPAGQTKLGGKDLALWTVYPVAYLLVTLVRGGVVNWYPYPFFDPAWETYASLNLSPRLGVALAIVLLTIFIIAIEMLAIRIHNRIIRRVTGNQNGRSSNEAV